MLFLSIKRKGIGLHVLIVGGGASGLLVAINLIRKSEGCEVTIVEPNEKLGLGLAYSTSDEDHLLNVPAGRMSGLVEEPKGLCEWAGVDENEFISRKKFGEYLDFLLKRELLQGKNLNHIRAKVIDVEVKGRSYSCALSNDEILDADSVVFALGNSDSITPSFFEDLPISNQVVRDIWREGLRSHYDEVAVIGTGLTFYDIALSILRDRPSAVIHGISRNGLLPRPHLKYRAPALPVPKEARESAIGIHNYLTSVGEKWREAQDGIRHDLQEIWAKFPEREKKNFINQHFRWWNSLRHRSAPEIDERIKSAIVAGQIIIHKAGINRAEFRDGKIELELTSGGQLQVGQLINCCGNQFVSTHPLLEKLIAKDLLARGPLDFGVACDPKSLALKDGKGEVHRQIFGIGPILVGELLETTAIPEIRVEAELIACEILAN